MAIADSSKCAARSFIEHTASPGAIRAYGIPVNIPFGVHAQAEGLRVLGADGFEWEVWSNDGFFVHARRERTEAENERYIDGLNARMFSGLVSMDRQQMCAAIADHIQYLAERKVARRDQRKIRRAFEDIARLAWIQTQLMQRSRVDMASMRRALAELGVRIEQRDFMGALEEVDPQQAAA